MMTICEKNNWRYLSKVAFLQDFRLYQWSTHIEKINTSKIKYPSKFVFLQDFHVYQWSTHEKINISKTNGHLSHNWQLN